MNIRNITIKAYGLLLRLYPSVFRSEFEEQMLLDFADMAVDAREKGRLAFLFFCLHELMDFPTNLLQAHLKEGGMTRIFRSEPVNYGLRGAVGFAVTWFVAVFLEEFIHWKITSYSDAIADFLSDIFHTGYGMQLVSLISLFVTASVIGLVLGMILAFLFADRSRYSRYMIVGMLSWFLSYAGTSICVYMFNMDFYLGSTHANYFMRMMTVLSTLFSALMFVVARSDKKGPYQALIVAALVYPLSLYFYIQLLFKVGWVETPVMFIALVVLVMIYIGSIFLIAIKCEDTPKIPWMFLLFVFGYFVVPGLMRLIYLHFFPMPVSLYSQPVDWEYTFLMALRFAIFEVPLGVFVGIALAFQKKNASMKLSTSG